MDKLKRYIFIYILWCCTGLMAYAQQEQTFTHTIEQGETVYAIATMYGVTPEAIYKLNPGSREGIKAGAELLIPKKEASFTEGAETETYIFHTIERKETLYAVSMKYKVPAQYIVEANPGLSVKTFRAGKTIRIPVDRNAGREPVVDKAAPQDGGAKEMEYIVQKRETMYSICRKFKVSSYELLKRNPALKRGVKAGMTIIVPIKDEKMLAEQEKAPAEEIIQSEAEVNALLSVPKDTRRMDQLKVALLLPFNPATKSAASSRFIEYYEGMLLAVDSLRSQGFSLDLSVYDTGDGTKRIREILTGETLPNVDLIIGAVQNDQIKLISDFAAENKIRYVIPFTSKNDDVLSNAYIYQVNTPHSYLYAKAAEAGCNLFADQNIVILNMEDSKDKKEFLKTFKAEMKNRNISYRQLTYHAETFNEEILSVLDVEKRNVILPSSGTLEALRKIKAPLRSLSEITDPDKQTYMITLFGYPEWQTYAHECLDDF